MTTVENQATKRLPMTSPVWAQVMEWLVDEAEELDRGQFDQWLTRMSEDVEYTMPVRVTRRRGEGDGVDRRHGHFEESIGSLSVRVDRVLRATQYAEDPQSRTRRFVTNVRVRERSEGEVEVDSYLLVLRNRGDSPTFDFLSCERHDVLTASEGRWFLSRREIIVDQTTLGTSNLAIFL